MKFGTLLYDLESQYISIEEVAEKKKVKVDTIKIDLRRLGYSIVDFRMWKDFKREKERLIRLCMNGMLSGKDFEERYTELKDGETTEGMRPVFRELEEGYI